MPEFRRRPHGPVLEKPTLKNPKATLKRFLGYLRPHVLTLILVFVFVTVSSFFGILSPYLIGKTIDEVFVPRAFDRLPRYALVLGSIYVLTSLLFWLQGKLMLKLSQDVVFRMRKELFEKLQRIPVGFFDKTPHGDIMSRLINDVDNINNVLGNSIVQVFSGIVTLIGVVIMMFRVDVLLSFVTLSIVPLTVLITRIVSSRTRKYFYENQKVLGELNGIIEEDISGLSVIKLFTREEKEIEKFNRVNEVLRKVGTRAQIFSGILPPLMNMVNNLGFALISGFGGWLALRGTITVGTIATFIGYSRQFTRPLNELSNQFNMIQMALASAERIFEILDIEEEKDDPEAIELKDVRGEIEFRNVWFSYDKKTPVLKNITFHIKPGQRVALVGPTGSGKTTIVNLLMRFYEVDEGQILIDGVDIRKIKKSSLRSNIGIVLQDTILFSTTVKENLRYANPDATDEEIKEAAKLTHADHFIKHLPEGYDTILTDNGEDLSQGQRQLLAITRVFIANPKILILDEATSNVDTKTEKSIQSAMWKLMEGKTSIIIAHRLNTIKNADLIIVLKDGEIVEMGKHDELMQNRGFYYELFTSQYGMILEKK
ncbi:multidrug ABC transporter ATP-binding protein [Thermotoga sp. RQ7]|uniref:ABC transporter ATP-binding protein n=1 Tax=Thermotoga sp. RQ7 TaxID=126738 RepID=UPI0005A367C2|nr:ABC transporter ATP-binding protein [Thermotoga sp. RQ7]AJG40507.1 multidrug ABC transporter ATP-binding protein [Thermotoga sp. RQ7]